MACRSILKLLTLLYLVALFGYAVGAFGVLGLATDQPSAVVLIVIGLPWVLAPLDIVVGQTFWPLVAVAAPIANLLIAKQVCRRMTA